MSHRIQVHRIEVADCACGASLLIPDRMRKHEAGHCSVCGSKIEMLRDPDGYVLETPQVFEEERPEGLR